MKATAQLQAGSIVSVVRNCVPSKFQTDESHFVNLQHISIDGASASTHYGSFQFQLFPDKIGENQKNRDDVLL